MSGPKIITDVSDLHSHVGADLGTSEWVEVTQSQIDAFAKATGDHQWIHVDVDRAKKESPFGRTIAHGYLTISMIPALLPQLLEVENVSMVVNYGVEKLRLPAPVPAGSRIRMSAEIQSVRRIPGGGARVAIGVQMEVEGSAKPACTANAIYAYFP